MSRRKLGSSKESRIGPKILAIKLRAIGDTVLWTPALASLREAFPQAEIHTLTYASNAAVLKNLSTVKVQHTLETKAGGELVKKLWSLRREKFDWILGFHATTSLCRWTWLSGAKRRVLHHHSRRYTPRGSLPVPHAGALEDVITRDYRVLEAMGLTPHRLPTKLEVSPEESRQAEEMMCAEIERMGGRKDLPRYLFLPGGSYSLKRYPKAQWLPLAEKMREEKQYQPVVIADGALSKELGLRADCDRLKLPLLDRTNLRQAITLISRGAKAFSNDSAPGHIAVALGVKTSFAFGPGCIGDFHPYDRKQHPLFRIAVDCRASGPRDDEAFQYCTVQECAHHRCMRDLKISLDQL